MREPVTIEDYKEKLEAMEEAQHLKKISVADGELDIVFKVVGNLNEVWEKMEKAKNSEDYGEIMRAVSEYSRSLEYAQGIFKDELVFESIAIEDIVKSPFISLNFGLENIGDVISKIYNSIMRVIQWIMGKISGWIKAIVAKCSTMAKDAKTLKGNLDNFVKNNPGVNTLSERASGEYLAWFSKQFPGANKLLSEHVSNTPGISGLGKTIRNLPIKLLDICYPNIDKMPLGNENEFLRGLVGFYRGKTILNSPKAIKDTPEFEKAVASTQKAMANDNDVVCRVYGVDMQFVYFVLLSGSELSKFKPIIDKVKWDKVQLIVPEIKADEVNKMFGGNCIAYLNDSLGFIQGNVNKAISEINKISSRISAVKKDMDIAYRKYKTNPGNKEVSKCINMYMNFCQKLVTKYQEGTVHGAVRSFKDLMAVSKRLYSDLIASASTGKAEAADKQKN